MMWSATVRPRTVERKSGSLTSPWLSNIVALLVGIGATTALALALLWRLGSWLVGQSEALNEDEGLAIGSEAPQIACHAGDQEFHLTLVGRAAFVAMGTFGCEPCRDLLTVAAQHPATSHMRLIYLSDTDQVEVDPQVAVFWELYRFHDEGSARRLWKAPVSPYFHVIDERGRVRAKGVANRPEHLDRLLSLQPAVFDGPPAAQMAAQGG